MKITLHPKSLVKSLFLLLLLSGSYYSFTNGSGAPAGNTAAPGDGNCTGCHTGSLITSGANWNNVSITTNVPAAGYTPGSSYTVTVSHTQTGINKFGFEFTALTSGTAAMAGSLSAGTGSQLLTSGSKMYLTHTAGGTAGSGSKSWSFTWTAPGAGTGDVKLYAAINAANSDNSTSGDQIYAKNIILSELSNLPTAVITGIPANNIVCLGDTLHLQGSGINAPFSYTWTFTGRPGSAQQNPDVVFTSIGQKAITLVTGNGFGSSPQNTQFVNVVAKPAATITPSGTVNICGSDSVTLTANFNALFSYQWTPGNQSSPSIKSNTPGLYKVKVTNISTGCAATSANVTLVQQSRPVAVLTLSLDTICSADSLQLFSNTPFPNYVFLDGATLLQSGTSASYKNIFAPGSRNMGLVVTDANGCKSDTVKQAVLILPKLAAPVLSCGAKTSFSVEFTWAAIAGASGYEVSTDTGQSWIPPNGTLAHTISGMVPNSNAQIWVRALDPSACAKGNTGTGVCTNGACNRISFAITHPDHVCLQSDTAKGAIPVTLSSISVASYGISYADSAYIKFLTYTAPVSLGANHLKISVLDSANIGCPPTDTTIVLTGVNPIAVKPVLVTDGPLCSGDSALHIIKVQHANSGANKFELYRNFSGAPFVVLTADGSSELAYMADKPVSPFQTGDELYAVAVENVFGCSKASDPITVTIEKTPAAGFTVNATGLSVIFDDTTAATGSRDWRFSGIFPDIPNGAKVITKIYPAAGSYTVRLVATALNGCKNDAVRTVVVSAVGINEVGRNVKMLSLYPNPVKDILNLDLSNNEPACISIYDLQGRLVKQEQLVASGTVDLRGLRNGLYSIYVQQGDTLYNGRFVKE